MSEDEKKIKETLKKIDYLLNEAVTKLNSVSDILSNDMSVNDSNVDTSVCSDDIKNVKAQFVQLKR